MPEKRMTGTNAAARIMELYEAYSAHSFNCHDESEAYQRLTQFRQRLERSDLALFQKNAEGGNAEAMCLLGATFLEGWLTPQNREKAAGWFRKAADVGDPMAQDILAGFYLVGAAPSLGFSKNWDEAIRLYRLAAQKGFVKSQSTLGVVLARNPATAREASEWMRKAAEAGAWTAMFNLALAYETGDGVERNRALAIEWYTKLAQYRFRPAEQKLRQLRPSWWQRFGKLGLFGRRG